MSQYLLPEKAEIIKITQETGSNLNIKTYRVRFSDREKRELFDFLPGQFIEVTVSGIGEAPFGFASSPTVKGFFEFSVKEIGLVTEALHNLKEGKIVGIRGPYGNGFPIEYMKGKDLIFIAGGIGLAPLRSLINYVLHENNRNEFGHIQMLLAFRSPADALYRDDYQLWENSLETEVKYTIDEPAEGWDYLTGFPHTLLAKELDCNMSAIYLTCGPPVMIKSVSGELRRMGVKPSHIITTLEMKMSCGLGKCGRCNIGHHYICRDGPVYTLDQLDKMPEEF